MQRKHLYLHSDRLGDGGLTRREETLTLTPPSATPRGTILALRSLGNRDGAKLEGTLLSDPKPTTVDVIR